MMTRRGLITPKLAQLLLVLVLLLSMLGVLSALARVVNADDGSLPEWKQAANLDPLPRAANPPEPDSAESAVLVASILPTYIYTDSTPVPDLDQYRCSSGTPVTLTITVPDDFTVGDLDVGINLTHTFRGDLELWLSSPAGTPVQLMDSSSDANDNYDVLLDDESPNPLNDGNDDNINLPYYDRLAQPYGSLSDFDGESAQGDWVLSICDRYHADTGTFNQWTLFFTEALPNTIGDLVWSDSDADGLQDPGKPGIPGITVTLYSGTAAIDTTTTDADGLYLFANLDPGDYFVEFTLPSGHHFSPQDAGVDDTKDSDADPVTGRTSPTTLTAGESDLTWDAGMFELATLGDYVWNDDNHDGSQSGGELGLLGVTVTLYTSGDSWISTTTTNDSGFYTFTDLLPGDYYLEFVLPDGYAFSPQNQDANDALDSDVDPDTGQTDTISLSPGDNDLDWDAGMYEAATLGDTVWEDLDANGIQDDVFQGVSGVTVHLYQCGGPFTDTTTTAADGSYAFTGLVPGDYYLEFTLPDGYAFSPQSMGGDATKDSDADPDTGQTICIPLIALQNDLAWDAGMYRFAELGDTVWEDMNINGLQDDGMTGINGVTVTLQYSGTGIISTTTTAADGSYAFTGLTPGVYSLTFDLLPGYEFSPQDQTGDTQDSDADPITGQTITMTLVSGQTDDTWDAGMYQRPSLGDYVWEDTDGDGIQDEVGTGISGVTVTLHHCSEPYSHTTTTDASGSYAFTDLGPGSYYVEFFPPPDYFFTLQDQGADPAKDSDADQVTGQTICTDLSSGENDTTWDAGMYQGIRLGDYVWEDLDGNGVQDGEPGMAGVVVTLTNSSREFIANTTTDVNGFYLFTNLAPGSYFIRFELLDGYAFSPLYAGGDLAKDSNAGPGGWTSVIPLPESGIDDLSWDAGMYALLELGNYVWHDLDGDGLQDDGESGISDVTVALYTCSGNILIDTTSTGANGIYTFTNLSAGGYYVSFDLPAGYAFSLQDQGSDDEIDSDVDPGTGQTTCINVAAGHDDYSWDAGMYPHFGVAVDKVAPPTVVNGVMTFTIRITNTGPITLEIVPLADHFDGPIEYIGGSPPADVVDNVAGDLTWTDLTTSTLGNMDPGAVFIVETVFQLTTPSAGFAITNTAVVTEVRNIYDQEVTGDSDTVIFSQEPHLVYLPLVVKNTMQAPNLVVKEVTATSDDVQVVIENQGNSVTSRGFWVDAYIDPDSSPTAVNQMWHELGSQGIAWAVMETMDPGEVITLTFNGTYYDDVRSYVVWPLATGAPVYAQVDSYDEATTYGSILEDHEITGGSYDNISGPVSVTGGVTTSPSAPSFRHFYSPRGELIGQ